MKKQHKTLMCIQVYVEKNLYARLDKLRKTKITKSGKKVKQSISEAVREILIGYLNNEKLNER